MPNTVWTIGHSTHPLQVLLEHLTSQQIELLADVRTVPRSRRHPHFSSDALAQALPSREIGYRHLKELGGWRKPRRDSPNTGWRNESFRGYADYALTAAFRAALDELCRLAGAQRTAIMCSEALWWRCHRRLIADRLVAAGWEVCHIGADGRTSAHRMSDFASVQPDGTILYPGHGIC